MRKFINEPSKVAQETLEGFLAIYGDQFAQVPGTLAVAKRVLDDKVAIVSGGGSGHEPVWLEYIGPGFADAVCQGDIFAAPAPQSIVRAAKAVERGRGILFVYGNYSGDRLNFDLAAEELQAEGHEVLTVRVADDVAAAPPDRANDRRGIAGGFFVSKIAGAASEAGLDLKSVQELATLAADRTRSMGVASAGGTIPGTDEPTFVLPDGKMEIGMGMHGEAGVRRADMATADETVDHMIRLIVGDRSLSPDEKACVLVNGLGATTRAELLIIARRTAWVLDQAGIRIHDLQVGDFATSQEMHGFSISVFGLTPELQKLYDAPGRTSFFSGANRH
ncbi:dihydroxyacetone kinase subunit DhaK [Nonomuraea turkmeniaca]|uniref:Dihydroxyacetone kinase subunit DhaK n=1 Tax=Nonomuraea turkmeniaca TaxID=103838 RepID=A0A5S4FDC5_9ACTN|nr:dihydroxyacetone kinase subunit DhaK [Nonomuraea turkmeniaca]TMR16505.1 dihydroxyacetone kinase subunit DhaK [Nonomuraea turkmeniaca]